MTYEAASQFAQTWGLVYAFAIFIAVCAYAMWPKNKAKFDRAARAPLDDDQEIAP